MTGDGGRFGVEELWLKAVRDTRNVENVLLHL
jgi:hypothetical protein